MFEQKIDIDALKYYVTRERPSGGIPSGQRVMLEYFNIFDSIRVKRSVALWVANFVPHDQTPETAFMQWCFGDLRGRNEYEIGMCPNNLIGSENATDVSVRISIYDAFLANNEPVLRALVDSVDVASAERWLGEDTRKVRRRREKIISTKMKEMRDGHREANS